MKQTDEWRYLPYDINTGATNMAIDEAILLAMAQNQAPPTLRFYGWQPATLSLGYAQSYVKEVNEEACRRAGIDIVRRPTGGRAVLHQYELTYSVIAPENDERVAGTVIESYLKISQALLEGLRAVGIPAEMVAHGEMEGLGSSACFDAPSWYELVVDGRKLVGSAQVRKDGILLQHGSIILQFDAELLFDVLNFSSEEMRQRLLRGFKRKACALDEVWTRPVTVAELERAICQGFRNVLAVGLDESDLTAYELELVEELVRKYQSADWTAKR